MNAHTIQTDWIDAPEAAALLADCAINPPAIRHHVDRYAMTADHWTEYARRDPRVKALHRLHDEAFEAASQVSREAIERVMDLSVDVAIENAGKAAFAAALERSRLAGERIIDIIETELPAARADLRAALA
jgi:hypothetical protein